MLRPLTKTSSSRRRGPLSRHDADQHLAAGDESFRAAHPTHRGRHCDTSASHGFPGSAPPRGDSSKVAAHGLPSRRPRTPNPHRPSPRAPAPGPPDLAPPPARFRSRLRLMRCDEHTTPRAPRAGDSDVRGDLRARWAPTRRRRLPPLGMLTAALDGCAAMPSAATRLSRGVSLEDTPTRPPRMMLLRRPRDRAPMCRASSLPAPAPATC